MNELIDINFSLILVLKLSFIITGIYISLLDGMVFQSISIFLQNNVKEFLLKPLILCLPCMSSVWTIILTQDINILLILCVCGLNAIIDGVISFIQNQNLTNGTDIN